MLYTCINCHTVHEGTSKHRSVPNIGELEPIIEIYVPVATVATTLNSVFDSTEL